MTLNRSFAALGKKAVLAGLAVLAITACQDAVSAPQGKFAASRPSFVKSTVGSTSFTYDPRNGSWARVGEVRIWMPAGSVCDPRTSGYGPGYWDKSCSPLKQKITISASAFTNTSDLPYVEFYPALRFQPGTNGGVVTLFVYDPTAAANPLTNIFYCNDTGACIDESKRDPSLAVQFDAKSGYVYRQLKHFSGYNVAAGYADSTGTTTTTTLSY